MFIILSKLEPQILFKYFIDELLIHVGIGCSEGPNIHMDMFMSAHRQLCVFPSPLLQNPQFFSASWHHLRHFLSIWYTAEIKPVQAHFSSCYKVHYTLTQFHRCWVVQFYCYKIINNFNRQIHSSVAGTCHLAVKHLKNNVSKELFAKKIKDILWSYWSYFPIIAMEDFLYEKQLTEFYFTNAKTSIWLVPEHFSKRISW